MTAVFKFAKKSFVTVLAAVVILTGIMPSPLMGLYEKAGGFLADSVSASMTYTPGTDWEKYGNYYFYNQMSATEREYYDALNERCLSFMINDEEATEYSYKNITYYLLGYVTSDDLTIAQMVQIAKIFKYNNPQYYFLSTVIFPKTSVNGVSFTVYPRFASYSSRESANSRVSHAIRSVLSNTSIAHSDGEKVLAIHDYLIDMAEYESNVINEDQSFTQSIYSVFATDEKKTVCAGYAGAFSVLCNAVGIDCICITSALHQWNKVRINDTWYNIDLTWDDKGLDEEGKSVKNYTYYCRSNNVLNVLDESDYHTIEDFWTDFVLPECDHDSGSTVDTYGDTPVPELSAVSPGYTAKASTAYKDQFIVSLYTATNGADIYYTTDGRTPEISSTKSRLYTKPFRVDKNTVVRAVAVREGYKDSSILKTTITEENSGGTSIRLSDCTVKLSKSKFKYTGSPIKPGITSVTYKGKELYEGVDYTITGYENNVSVGTAKMIITAVAGSNYKGSKTVSYSISAYLLSAPVVNVKNIYQGIRLSWSQVEMAKGYIIERKEAGKSYKRIKKITSAKKTAFNDKKVERGKKYYYRVTAYSAGNEYRKTYCKSILTYRILPVSVSEVVSEKKESMKVSWKKDGRASGYQVKYVTGGTGRMFNVSKTYTAATVTGLDSGKTYRVYVRSYKNIDDKVIYAKWSPAKKVVVK